MNRLDALKRAHDTLPNAWVVPGENGLPDEATFGDLFEAGLVARRRAPDGREVRPTSVHYYEYRRTTTP